MSTAELPSTNRYCFIKKFSTDVRKAVEIGSEPVPKVKPEFALIRNKFIGVNASIINLTAGVFVYNPESPAVEGKTRIGADGLGQVVAVGEGSRFKVGQFVAYLLLTEQGYSDYVLLDNVGLAVVVPSPDPAYMVLLVSGVTASVGFEEKGDLKAGDKVLVSTAAGATGHIAAQLAKLAGCHVIGTCSTPEKANFLKQIGCDRIINYKEESVEEVLDKEYPNAIDVVYECVGKQIFEPALKNLAVNGRVLVIGQISTYESGGLGVQELKEVECKYPIALTLLMKSASVRGFLLYHYFDKLISHYEKLKLLYEEGLLKVMATNGKDWPSGPFVGLEKVPDAVEYMYSRKNIGKVYVEL